MIEDLREAPCPRWSLEETHPAHEWDAPVDGRSKCPGWGDDLRDRYAEAIASCMGGTTFGAIADAVLAVRDEELERLRERARRPEVAA